MARGAAATIRSNQSRSRVARVGKPKVSRATTNNVSKRLVTGGFDRTESVTGLGSGVNISGYLRGERS